MTVWAPILVAVVVAVVPLMSAWLTGRQLRAAKVQDWARDDALREREQKERAQVAAQVAAAAAEVAAVKDHLVESTNRTDRKLDDIHVLVNSSMTAAKQAELAATRREVVLLRENAALHEAAGRSPSDDASAALTSAEDRLGELQDEVEDRERRTASLDKQDAPR